MDTAAVYALAHVHDFTRHTSGMRLAEESGIATLQTPPAGGGFFFSSAPYLLSPLVASSIQTLDLPLMPKCSSCGKYFARDGNLTTHIRKNCPAALQQSKEIWENAKRSLELDRAAEKRRRVVPENDSVSGNKLQG